MSFETLESVKTFFTDKGLKVHVSILEEDVRCIRIIHLGEQSFQGLFLETVRELTPKMPEGLRIDSHVNTPTLNLGIIYNNIDYNTPKGWERIEKYAQSILECKGYKVECNEETNKHPVIDVEDYVSIGITAVSTGERSLLVIWDDSNGSSYRIKMYPKVRMYHVKMYHEVKKEGETE